MRKRLSFLEAWVLGSHLAQDFIGPVQGCERCDKHSSLHPLLGVRHAPSRPVLNDELLCLLSFAISVFTARYSPMPRRRDTAGMVSFDRLGLVTTLQLGVAFLEATFLPRAQAANITVIPNDASVSYVGSWTDQVSHLRS
jgi:hypothetical protein